MDRHKEGCIILNKRLHHKKTTGAAVDVAEDAARSVNNSFASPLLETVLIRGFAGHSVVPDVVRLALRAAVSMHCSIVREE